MEASLNVSRFADTIENAILQSLQESVMNSYASPSNEFICLPFRHSVSGLECQALLLEQRGSRTILNTKFSLLSSHAPHDALSPLQSTSVPNSPGSLIIPFSLTLPLDIPATYCEHIDGYSGKIHYCLTAEATLHPDDPQLTSNPPITIKHVLDFIVVSSVNPNTTPVVLEGHTRIVHLCCIKRGVAHMRVHLDRVYYTPGDTVQHDSIMLPLGRVLVIYR